MNQIKKIFYLAFGLSMSFAFPLFAQWSPVGAGVTYRVLDFQVWNGKLYMGPISPVAFMTRGICSYDGVNYDSLDYAFGTGGAVSIAVYKDTLYAGGDLGLGPWPYVPCSANIDKWDGTNWSCVGAGGPNSNEIIYAMAAYNGELYVGGVFFSMGGVSTKFIARWDGSQWKTVGGGLVNGGPGTGIYAMAVYNNELYVGGLFSQTGNITTYNIARWNGTQWDSLNSYGVNGDVRSFAVDTVNNILYIGGGIIDAGGVPCWSVAKWDGNNFSSPGIGITNGALAMTMYQGKLVVGGYDNIGSVTDTTLATWDGTYWCPIVPGPNSTVSAMEVYNGELYIGGYFDTVATIPASHIVKWSGNLCPNSGVNETAGQIKFKVFPNPAKQQITIEIQEARSQKPEEKYLVRIKNSLGQEIFQQSFPSTFQHSNIPSLRIDTSPFKAGIYLIEVCTAEGVVCHTEKVVIQ